MRRTSRSWIAATAASVVGVILARVAQPFAPVSDIALTEIYAREAARLHLLVGPYSRFGWHHPGPLYFYWLAPFYAVGGHTTAALNAGALTLSLATVAATAFVAEKQFGRPIALLLVVALLGFLVRVPPLIVSSWNAHAIVLPSVLLMLLAGGPAIAALALVASFLVQTDVALAPFVAAVVLIALVSNRPSAWRRALLGTAIVLAVVWLPVVIERDNVGQLWRFFVTNRAAGPGFGNAVAIWADAVTAPFRPGLLLAKGTPIEPTFSSVNVALAIGLVAATGAAVMFAIRRQKYALARFAFIAVASSVVTLIAATRIEGGLSDHQSFWFGIIGVVDLVCVVGVALPPMFIAPFLIPAAVTIVALLGVYQMNLARQGIIPVTESAYSAPNFATSIRDYLQRTHAQRPLIRLDDHQWELGVGILLQLDRADVPFAVDDDWMPMFPGRFRATGREDAEITLAARGSHRELAARPDNETVDVSTFIHVEAVPLRR
ncbi:MAG TPA: hypothetical protein VFA59_01720 [Vicinamibacterales bacterium]|nr:hypothetical protein [Vicinamibacterales bacterium]